MTLIELFDQLNAASLRLRRSPGDQVEIVGDTSLITDRIRKRVRDNLPAILPGLPLPPEEQSKENANTIRQHLEAFAAEFNPSEWTIDCLEWVIEELAKAVDSKQPKEVIAAITGIRGKLAACEWASRAFPRTFAVEGDAGPSFVTRTWIEIDRLTRIPDLEGNGHQRIAPEQADGRKQGDEP